MVKREWLNDLLAKAVAISSAFSIRPNKVKKASKFLLLRAADGGNGTSIISAFILSKSLLSKSLSEPDLIPLKFAIYWAVFLSKH